MIEGGRRTEGDLRPYSTRGEAASSPEAMLHTVLCQGTLLLVEVPRAALLLATAPAPWLGQHIKASLSLGSDLLTPESDLPSSASDLLSPVSEPVSQRDSGFQPAGWKSPGTAVHGLIVVMLLQAGPGGRAPG